MKYLFLICLLYLATNLGAQQAELTEIKQLVNSFEKNQDLESLKNANQKLTKLFKEKDLSRDLNALIFRSKVLSLVYDNIALDDPTTVTTELYKTYSAALSADKNNIYRTQLLNELYDNKAKIVTNGNKAYENKDYKFAHSCAETALKLNALEIEYPKTAAIDTSVLFSKAIFAKLSNNSDVAIKDFEKLVDMKFYRSDPYDYLFELYTQANLTEKAEKIRTLKAERFPENER